MNWKRDGKKYVSGEFAIVRAQLYGRPRKRIWQVYRSAEYCLCAETLQIAKKRVENECEVNDD